MSNSHFNFVQQGHVNLFSHFDSNGKMWAESGDREVLKTVNFKTHFQSTPIVQLSVTLMDADSDKFTRYSLNVDNVGFKSFDISFKTWLDSRFARVWVNWIAMGERRDPDMWDV